MLLCIVILNTIAGAINSFILAIKEVIAIFDSSIVSESGGMVYLNNKPLGIEVNDFEMKIYLLDNVLVLSDLFSHLTTSFDTLSIDGIAIGSAAAHLIAHAAVIFFADKNPLYSMGALFGNALLQLAGTLILRDGIGLSPEDQAQLSSYFFFNFILSLISTAISLISMDISKIIITSAFPYLKYTAGMSYEATWSVFDLFLLGLLGMNLGHTLFFTNAPIGVKISNTAMTAIGVLLAYQMGIVLISSGNQLKRTAEIYMLIFNIVHFITYFLCSYLLA